MNSAVPYRVARMSFPELILAYLESLRNRASYDNRLRDAGQWILTLSATPTRKEIIARHTAKGHGHFQPGATQANSELSLIRAACRWGIYHERWDGGDPTAGIRFWRTPKRKRISKFDELNRLLHYFDRASTDIEIRDRALYGLMLCTGCRPSEARTTRLTAITPYGEMGSWLKGQTKTGELQEVPLPKQLMPWIAAWKAIRPASDNLYLFPGQAHGTPIGPDNVRTRWETIRTILGITGLWTYDLRRTLSCYMGNELHYDDKKIDAILNHEDRSSLGHYYFVSFDALTLPIQAYADWLWALKDPLPTGDRQTINEPCHVSLATNP